MQTTFFLLNLHSVELVRKFMRGHLIGNPLYSSLFFDRLQGFRSCVAVRTRSPLPAQAGAPRWIPAYGTGPVAQGMSPRGIRGIVMW